MTPRRIECANCPSPIEAAVAVAGDAEIDQVAVGEIGAGEHRRHAPVHRIKAVRIAEEVGRRLRRAADAGNLGDAMRLDRQFETGLDDGGGDRVMAAPGAQRRHRALVVAVGVAEVVLRQRRMVEFRFGEVSHGEGENSRRDVALKGHKSMQLTAFFGRAGGLR